MDFEQPPITLNQPVTARKTSKTERKKNRPCVRNPIRIRNQTCAFCAKTFVDTYQLERHIRTHTGEKPFMCPEANCPYSSTQAATVKVHVNSVHNQRNPYPCSLCSASFRKFQFLTSHLANHKGMPASVKKSPLVSSQEKPQLPKKAQVSRPKSQMKISSFNERDPTKFQTRLTLSTQYTKGHICVCPTCGFAVPNRTIVSHRRFHEGTGTHSCVVCRVSYMERSNMSRHLKSRLHVMRMGLGGTKGVSRISQSLTRAKGAHLNEFKKGTSSSEKCPTSLPELTESKLWTKPSVTPAKNEISTNKLTVNYESSQRTQFTTNPALKRMRSSEDPEEVSGWVSEANSRITWSRDTNQNLVGTQFCGRLKICGIRYKREV